MKRCESVIQSDAILDWNGAVDSTATSEKRAKMSDEITNESTQTVEVRSNTREREREWLPRYFHLCFHVNHVNFAFAALGQ